MNKLLFIALCVIILPLFHAQTARAQTAPAQSSRPALPPAALPVNADAATTAASKMVDLAAAELMRDWLAGREPGAAARGLAAQAEHDDPGIARRFDDWRAYHAATGALDPAARERLLREVYDRTQSPELRERILQTIHEDPSFRSRQAMFIRHYGYYAGWFNRVLATAARVVQGNVQAVLQLPIDAVNDVFQSREADPRLRQAYDMMRRAEAMKQRPGYDKAEIKKIEKRVDKTLAGIDYDQAEWALHTGDAQAAAFYAAQAAERVPEMRKAARLRDEALSEDAASRRRALASDQVGYPDRTPPFDAEAPEILRAALTGGKIELTKEQKPLALVADVLASRPAPEAGWAGHMRGWPALAKKDGKTAPSAQLKFIEALMLNPAINPDLRLEQARATRRGERAKYIFAGADSTRERAYKTTSAAAQTLNALHNIGFLYLFEVVGRAMKVAVSPPTPDDSVFDAEAAWLRESPDPQSREARTVARGLARAYTARERWQQARLALLHSGELDKKSLAAIDESECKRLYYLAKSLPPGPDRDACAARIKQLAPVSKWAVKVAALSAAPARRRAEEAVEMPAAWDAVARWADRPLPAGLPGQTRWFNGNRRDGEADKAGPTFIFKGEIVRVRYAVNLPEGRRSFEENVEPGALAPRLRDWLELVRDQRGEAGKNVERFERLPVPFEIAGDAGLSGFDFQPQLLPIETEPGELELYK